MNQTPQIPIEVGSHPKFQFLRSTPEDMGADLESAIGAIDSESVATMAVSMMALADGSLLAVIITTPRDADDIKDVEMVKIGRALLSSSPEDADVDFTEDDYSTALAKTNPITAMLIGDFVSDLVRAAADRIHRERHPDAYPEGDTAEQSRSESAAYHA